LKSEVEWIDVRWMNEGGDSISSTARTGITKHVHPHLLRRARITQLHRDGMDVVKLNEFAGHK